MKLWTSIIGVVNNYLKKLKKLKENLKKNKKKL